jgi:uncharacterized protein (TIGR02145 family)
MKKAFKTAGLILIILLSILIHSCKKEKPAPPVLTTTTVTEVSYTTAVSGGNVTSEGGATVIARGICWNTQGDPIIANSNKAESGTTGAFVSNLTNLTPNTKYYVKAFATNAGGTGYGDQVTFTTVAISAPVLTTTSISSITQTTASSGGNITDDKGGSITSRGVCWSTSVDPTTTDSKTSDGTGTGTYISSITGLTGNTTYYLKAYATNSAATSYGEVFSFKTSPVVPVVSTVTASSISYTSCNSGGNVSDDGGAAVTAKGVCWSTSQNPTTSDSKTDNGTGTGAYVSSMTGLTAGTTYYIRAYATNGVGTQYGNQVSFTTYPLTITDVDGNIYNTVLIGSQLWMKENLKTTKYQNGDLIGTTNPVTLDISRESSPKYQWAYEGNESNVPIYGRLYTGYAATDNRNVCPTGWHVPTDNEWTTLTDYLTNNSYGYGGTGSAIGKSLASKTGWSTDPTPGNVGNDQPGNNASGFTGLPAGTRNADFDVDGVFTTLSYTSSWWSATDLTPTLAWQRFLMYSNDGITRSYIGGKQYAVSVRCLKDN